MAKLLRGKNSGAKNSGKSSGVSYRNNGRSLQL